MRLISLQMKNFRQFYGTTPKIKFAHGDKNITVLHGCNGSGKTALLNAFTWTLFNSHSAGFLYPEQIVNIRAIREAQSGETVEGWVTIEFEHESRKYKVKRAAQVDRFDGDPGWVLRDAQIPTLQWAGPDGEWAFEERVYDAIGRVLPADLHTYFFFDGERIERLSKPTDKERKEIGNATKKLLGIEIFHRAEGHLDNARRELEKEFKKVGDAQTAKLIDEKQGKEEQSIKLKMRQIDIQEELIHHKEREKAIEGLLRQLEGVKEIQERRDVLNRDHEARSESYHQGKQALSKEISTNGHALFLKDAVESFNGVVEDLRQRGELPSGIKKQFVADLLERNECICTRPLVQGTPERDAIEVWERKAGLIDVEEKAIHLGGEIRKLPQVVDDFLVRIEHIQSKRNSDRSQLSRIENELEDIKDKLKGSPQEETQKLERQLEDVEQKGSDLNMEYGGNRRTLKQLEETINDLEDQIDKHRVNEEKQALAKRRVAAAKEACEVISQIRESLEKSFRKGLGEKITKLFQQISPTPYVPSLGSDYSLRLLDSAGGTPLPVAASTGEFQILSLSFIGSIIQEAREYHAKRENLPGPEASSYPVVMDSPFGSLDPTYRHQIAENLPLLADQIVVMVTKTQWRNEVEQSMTPRVGRSYVLTYNTPKDDVQEEVMVIKGESYPLIKKSANEFEYTLISEV